MRAYSDPSREHDKWSLPVLEIFYAGEGELEACNDCETCKHAAGFFWWSCFPGCMPDSDPHGPFDTEDEALKDARDVCGE